MTAEQKEAARIKRIFKETFSSGEGKEALTILQNSFDMHLPSMSAVGFDTHRAAYMDGQKSIFLEINDIMAGKYDPETSKTEQDNE